MATSHVGDSSSDNKENLSGHSHVHLIKFLKGRDGEKHTIDYIVQPIIQYFNLYVQFERNSSLLFDFLRHT